MSKTSEAQLSKLSELEGAVLGVVHAGEDLTAHGVREAFRQSRSSHWSGSAGAIYPLIKKLHQSGLLKAKETPRGNGVRRAYSLTGAGRLELRRWIGPPLSDSLASVTFDPLRSRIGFLGVLDPARQEAFLEEAAAHLEKELRESKRERAQLRTSGTFWDLAAADGCVAITEARLKWVRKCREALKQAL